MSPRLRFILLFSALFLFTAAAAFGQTITLTAPNGGSLTLGSRYNITWTVTGSLGGNVRLVLFREGRWVGDIASGIPTATGTYSWTVGQHSEGTAVAGGGYKVRIRHMARDIQDESDNPFTLVAALATLPVVMRPLRTMILPAIIERCYKRAYQRTSWNCLDTMGIEPSVYGDPGDMQVGYHNYYRERAAVCRNEWRVFIYRAWVRFDNDRLMSIAGQNIQKAELQMRNTAISVEHGTEPMCAKGVYILQDPGQPGFAGFDVRSLYIADLPPVPVGGLVAFDMRGILERWHDRTYPNYGIMIRGKVEDLGARNNDKCISVFSDVKLFIQYTAR